ADIGQSDDAASETHSEVPCSRLKKNAAAAALLLTVPRRSRQVPIPLENSRAGVNIALSGEFHQAPARSDAGVSVQREVENAVF
ncbi:MAG: hypothetical protein RLO48_01460, partial [Bauldia litoralis]